MSKDKSGYDLVADAIKKYLRDYFISHDEIEHCGATTFYVLVKELKPFYWEDVWIVEVEDCGPEPEDINCTFVIDYDEGQAIEVLKVIPDYDMEEILFDYYKREKEYEQGQI